MKVARYYPWRQWQRYPDLTEYVSKIPIEHEIAQNNYELLLKLWVDKYTVSTIKPFEPFKFKRTDDGRWKVCGDGD